MRSIKRKLLFTILGIIIVFSILIFVVTLSQLFVQQKTIQNRGQEEAKVLAQDTEKELGKLHKIF